MKRLYRPWTAEENDIVLNRTDLSSQEIGRLINRKPGSVLAQRSFLKRGGGQREVFWTEAEDDVIRQLAGRAIPAGIAAKLPGRTAASVKQRRSKLGLLQPAGIRLSPFTPAGRRVLAKTCRSCGLLHDGSNFRRNQGGGLYLSTNCLHCLSAAGGTYKAQSTKTYVRRQELQRDWRRRMQAETAKHATRNGYPYLESDFEVLSDPSLTLFTKALKLKRTYRAVSGMCQSKGFKSEGRLLTHHAAKAWHIDNPNASRVEEITAALKQECAAAGVQFPEWDWDDEDLTNNKQGEAA